MMMMMMIWYHLTYLLLLTTQVQVWETQNSQSHRGVEFRNRLQTEFDGVNMPNSMVFDYPTVTAPCLSHVRVLTICFFADICTTESQPTLWMEKSEGVDWTGVIIAYSTKILQDPWRHDGVSWCIFAPLNFDLLSENQSLKSRQTSIQHTSVWRSTSKNAIITLIKIILLCIQLHFDIPLSCFTVFHQCHLKELAGYINSQCEAQYFSPGSPCGLEAATMLRAPWCAPTMLVQ